MYGRLVRIAAFSALFPACFRMKIRVPVIFQLLNHLCGWVFYNARKLFMNKICFINIVVCEVAEMSEPESWENVCCRCEGDVKEAISPGKRACHVTCGPCLYPDNPKCASCEIVGHCRLALDHFKSLKEVAKGRYFNDQLTGEETLYHTLSFVDAQQHLVKELGEKRYLEELKKTNGELAEEFPTIRTVSIPIVEDELWSWAQYRAELLGFESVTDYVFKLIRMDRERRIIKQPYVRASGKR